MDVLYWQPTEAVDWMLTNNLSTQNQTITYKTLELNYTPGFRIGISREGDWDTKLYFTRLYSKTSDSATGNLTSAFFGGKSIQTDPVDPSNDFFYQSGQANLAIHFNIIDWDIGKRFYITQKLMLHPLIGLEGGWIDQTINSSFQGPISISERVTNNFKGIGPKIGVDGRLNLVEKNQYQLSLIAGFATSYLWGTWVITDKLQSSAPGTMSIQTKNRNFGALSFQSSIGAMLSHKNMLIKLSYEISDWFNQFQIFDDATGAHNNDLVFQGVTLGVAYDF